MTWSLVSLWPLSFLLVAVVDDLVFKKFHNWLFIALSLIGLGFVLGSGSLSLWQALGGFLIGGLLMLPLVLLGAMGAGDMKFMMCFGLILGMLPIFSVFIYALFWGALIGVLQAVFAGKLSSIFNNLKMMSLRLKPTNVRKIPYTVAILFGWLTWVQVGGLL